MTREEIEQLNGFEPYCIETDREQSWYEFGLVQGLETADANPKSPWISVKDDLPCNHEELIISVGKSKYGTIKETKDVIVYYTGKYFGIRHMASVDDEWRWYPQNSDILYWMPTPELPKE